MKAREPLYGLDCRYSLNSLKSKKFKRIKENQKEDCTRGGKESLNSCRRRLV